MDGILQEEQISIAETIGDTVERFLAGTKNGVACLKEIYQATTKWPQESVRCSIYRDRKKRFKRVGKGVYLLTGEKSASLLIHGDGRKLDEIEDGSISAIINDHPWKNEKAHKSGNQKCFADYDTFCYTQEDFDQKARVLVNGGYLAEFLPVRSFSNREYLNQIEMMAEKSGLDYYASILWRKAPEGKINTGRTTKGIEQIVIFTKGKARCLNAGGKAYQTTNILTYEVDIPANKGKMKTHQAEKPIPLYEYLIEQLTREGDICLDQFGGSCNMAKASVLKNRFALIYEVCRDFVESAVRCFNMLTLCECSEEEMVIQEETPVEQEVYKIETIPAEVTSEQIEFLRKVLEQRPELLTERERATVENQDSQIVAAREIHEIYQAVNERGYSTYEKGLPSFDVTNNLLVYGRCSELYRQIDRVFEAMFPNHWLRIQHENYRYEARNLAAFCVTKKYNIASLEDAGLYLREYYGYLKDNGYRAEKSYRLLCEFFNHIPLQQQAA